MNQQPFATPKIDVFVAAETPLAIDPGELVPVFHRFIQTARLDDLLIDVADYRHVPGGPGVVLIGHDAFYSFGGERVGLHTSRRRETRDAPGTSGARVHSVLRRAVLVCQALEQAEELAGRLRFRYGALELRWNDRLHAPNEPAAQSRMLAELAPLLRPVFGAGSRLAALRDPRGPLGVSVDAPGPLGAADLLARLASLAA